MFPDRLKLIFSSGWCNSFAISHSAWGARLRNTWVDNSAAVMIRWCSASLVPCKCVIRHLLGKVTSVLEYFFCGKLQPHYAAEAVCKTDLHNLTKLYNSPIIAPTQKAWQPDLKQKYSTSGWVLLITRCLLVTGLPTNNLNVHFRKQSSKISTK